jgi:hypothetical protein
MLVHLGSERSGGAKVGKIERRERIERNFQVDMKYLEKIKNAD